MPPSIATRFLLWVLGLVVACSLAHAQERQFPPDAVVNVTLAPYGAKPDGVTDNTAVLQRAISENVGTGRVLYFPAGIYLISDTLAAKNTAGHWEAHLTLQGQGRDKAILRLKNGAAGFENPSAPKAMLMTGSHYEKGDSLAGGGNKAFRNNIFDLTIDAGSDNPGAMGVEYAVSNFGAIQNVTVRSGDGRGVAGIALKRQIPGPGLIKNVSVTGFDYGVDVGDMEYGITLEDVAVKNQRIAGIRNSQNVLHIRHLTSVNRGPAVQVTAAGGVLTLLDSQLTGGTGDQAAVDCAGSLLVRNVKTSGYRAAAIRCRGKEAVGPDYAQWVWPGALGSEEKSTNLLPIEETPEYWNSNPADWMAVGARRPGEPDDTAAIQRAFDSGKGTIYLPNNRSYFLSDTVIVRCAVRQVLGMGAEISLGAAKEPFSDRSHLRPLIRIDATDSPAVFFENLFFNAQYPGEILFENNSPKTVVIKHCGGWVGAEGSRHSYRNTVRGTGKLFLEDDFLPGWEFKRQNVWARQLNPENWDGDGTEPQVANAGGKLWILGFKTEGAAPFIATTEGGTTELLGAYNYVSATKANTVPTGAVPYIVTDSSAALTFTSDNFRKNDYPVYIRVMQNGAAHEMKGTDLLPRDGNRGCPSFVVPLFQNRSKEK